MGQCKTCGRSWSYDESSQQDNRCFNCQNIKKNISDPWDIWIENNKEKLIHPANYELLFVNNILRKIPCIKPTDVHAQYHFYDNNGKNRYIDFYIKNEKLSYSLPIELDGLWKVENYSDFDDMMLRQNALLNQFKCLLRYTNKQMISQPNSIIKNITETLEKQKTHQDVTKLVITASNAQSELYKKQILELESKLKLSQIEKPQQNDTNKIQGVTTSTMLKIGISFLMVVIICAFFYKSILKNRIDTPSNQNVTSVSPSAPIKPKEENLEKNITRHEEIHHIDNKTKLGHSKQQVSQSAAQIVTPLNIDSKDAIQNIGSEKIVCGIISQQKTFAKGIYLNMGGHYPNQDITFVIWNDDISKLPLVQEMIGNTMCIYGKILNHRGTPQINLKQSSQIR